jgi:TolB protein
LKVGFALLGILGALAVTWAGGADGAPYSGVLVFQSDKAGNWDLFLVAADGTDPRRLTRHPAHDRHPVWSPKGDRIAFCSERTGSGDIYVMNADGSSLRRLTEHPEYEGAPSWSPDGKWIAFEGERDGRSEIYRVDVQSGRVTRLTDSFSRKLGPAVSPDGNSIVFMDRGLMRWQIALMQLESGESRILTGGWGNCRPEWSPDGRLLAFVSTRDSKKADVRLMDMARSTVWKLHTRPNAHNYDPSFSPDGSLLAFASTIDRPPGEWDLFLVDINGRNLLQLTSGPENDRFPDWRPRPVSR